MKQLLRTILLLATLTMLAVTASAQRTLNTQTFKYAYSVNIDDAYPKVGQQTRVWHFEKPLTKTGSTSSSGSFKIHSLGKYNSKKKYETTTHHSVKKIAQNVASKYGIAIEQVEVVQLSKDGKNICQGVLCAIGSDFTYFLGTTYWANGCGFFLTNKAHKLNDDIKIKPTSDAKTRASGSTSTLPASATEFEQISLAQNFMLITKAKTPYAVMSHPITYWQYYVVTGKKITPPSKSVTEVAPFYTDNKAKENFAKQASLLWGGIKVHVATAAELQTALKYHYNISSESGPYSHTTKGIYLAMSEANYKKMMKWVQQHNRQQ